MREAQTGARTDAPARARFPQNLSDSRTDSRRMKPRPPPWRKQRRTATSSARGHPLMCTSSIVPLEPVAAKPARQLAWFAPNETDAARLAECSGDPQRRPRAVTQSCVRAASPTWGWSPQNLSDSRTASHRMKPKTLASRNGAASHDVVRARTPRWGHDQSRPHGGGSLKTCPTVGQVFAARVPDCGPSDDTDWWARTSMSDPCGWMAML